MNADEQDRASEEMEEPELALGPPTRIVHRAAPEVAEAFAARLRAEGVAAEALDRPGLLTLLATFGTYRVRIAVPPQQEERARETMERWDRDRAGSVRDLSAQVGRQARLAALPFLLVAALGFVFARGWDWIPWLACAAPAASLLAFLALAAFERARGDR